MFKLGPENVPDAVTGKIVALPARKFASLKILAVGVNGDQELQTFTVTYTDGTSSSFSQSLSDWASAPRFKGESIGATMGYRLVGDGGKDSRSFYAFAYTFALDKNKQVRSLSLPSNRDVIVFAATMVPAAD